MIKLYPAGLADSDKSSYVLPPFITLKDGVISVESNLMEHVGTTEWRLTYYLAQYSWISNGALFNVNLLMPPDFENSIPMVDNTETLEYIVVN